MVNLGAGVGTAFAYAPVLLGVFLLPAVYWVGVSRFNPAAAVGFGLLVLVQLNALLHGGVEPTVAVSMYYNNWCWAISAVVVALAVLPNGRAGSFSKIAEPVFLGVGVALLVLIKATFAVFLLPAIIVGMLLHKAVRQLAIAMAVCLVFLAAVTAPIGGVAYWQGYVADLMFVAQSPARAQPGDPLALMVLSPTHLVAIIGLMAGFLFLRQAKLMGQGLVFLALAAGWIFVTHQNWQNDPHWLGLAGLILFAMRQDVVLYNRFGWPLHGALGAVATGFLVLAAPLFLAQVQSALVHSGLNGRSFQPASPHPKLADLRFRDVERGRYTVVVPAEDLGSDLVAPAVLNGETLPDCQRSTGLVQSMMQMGAALDGISQTHGAQVLNADWVNGLWLFSKTEPLHGGAPWYYGGVPGLAGAEFVVVPLCPMGQGVRRIMLEEIEKAGVQLEEVNRNALFVLLKKAE